MAFSKQSSQVNHPKKKILINATNLKKGGSVPFGVSFLFDLNKKEDFFLMNDVSVYVSRNIDLELRGLGVSLSLVKDYRVFDMGVFRFFLPFCFKFFKGFDLIFNVYGPQYLPSFGAVRVDGFADVTLIYKDVYVSLLSLGQRLFFLIKRSVKWFFYKKANFFIVEIEHARERLVDCFDVSRKNIFVVSSTLSSVFLNETNWSTFKIPKDTGVSKETIKIGFVGRDYKHKNLNLLPKVYELLKEVHGLDVKFYVTLTDSEWSLRSREFKEACVNVGAITASECPGFYMQMQGVIFPSLLECFSVTPLEALYMKLPLFASDREFVRDVCLQYAYYFDPLNPVDVALCISSYFKNKRMLSDFSKLDEGRAHVLSLYSSTKRCESYVKIIDDLLKDSVEI